MVVVLYADIWFYLCWVCVLILCFCILSGSQRSVVAVLPVGKNSGFLIGVIPGVSGKTCFCLLGSET